jgi:DNA-binding NarL/FixJ family response regulator
MTKILLIEDEPSMRKGMATALEMEGFQVATAPDGRAGITAAQAQPPDLILCDVMMPEVDGYGVLEALRSDPEATGIPFIFLTAKGEKPDIRYGMNLGADDYLTKPCAVDDLLSAIRARLARKTQNTQHAIAHAEFTPDFSSSVPLEAALCLTPKEAEVLLWVAQGKSNAEIGVILNNSESTVKKHMEHILEKLGVESRGAAGLRAIEVLSRASEPGQKAKSVR